MTRCGSAPARFRAPDELAPATATRGLGVHLFPESVRYLWLDRAAVVSASLESRPGGKAGGFRS